MLRLWVKNIFHLFTNQNLSFLKKWGWKSVFFSTVMNACFKLCLILYSQDMVTLLFSALLLVAMALAVYCYTLNELAQPRLSVMVSEVRVVNDNRVSKKLVKSLVKNVQKPSILESHCTARASRPCRRFASSSSSAHTVSPSTGHLPATSSAHLKKMFREWCSSLNAGSCVQCCE